MSEQTYLSDALSEKAYLCDVLSEKAYLCDALSEKVHLCDVLSDDIIRMILIHTYLCFVEYITREKTSSHPSKSMQSFIILPVHSLW